VTVREGGATRTFDWAGHHPLTIGRSPENDIALATSRASRKHAEIVGETGRFTLIDLGSANGTEVDGARGERAPLAAGSTIRIGEAVITFGEVPQRRAPGRSRAAPPAAPAASALAAAPPLAPAEFPSPPPSSPPRVAPAAPAALPPARAARRKQRVSPTTAGAAALLALVAIGGIAWSLREMFASSGALPSAPASPSGPVAAIDGGSEDGAGPRATIPDVDRATRGGDDDAATSIPLLANATAPAAPLPEPIAIRAFDPPEIVRAETRESAEESTEESEPVRRGRVPLGDGWPLVDGPGAGAEPDPAAGGAQEVGLGAPPPATPAGADAAGSPDEPPAGDGPRLLRIIEEAWPPGARTIGYEYNQKNHTETPDFVERKGPGIPERNSAASGPRYRVIGIEVRLDAPSPAEGAAAAGAPVAAPEKLKLRSKQVRGGEKVPLLIPGSPVGDRVRRYFAIEEPKDRRVLFELLDREGEVIATAECVLPPGGRTTALAAEALAIEREREREEWERAQLAARDVTIDVFDDLNRPVPGARVLLLAEGGGLATFEGTTDADGRLTRAVIPGAYAVLVHAEVPEPIDPDANTVVIREPRFLSLAGRIAADESALRLVPSRSVLVSILDEGESPLPIERIWVTPAPIAEAYRYEDVEAQVGVRGRLDSTRRAAGALRLLLGDLPVELGLLGRTAEGEPVLIGEQVTPAREEISWAFRRDRFAEIGFDPAAAAGGATALEGEICAAGRFRERFRFVAEGPWRAWVIPGRYRLDLRAHLPAGIRAGFLPYAVDLLPGDRHELAPRAPWAITLYQHRKDRENQFWVAIVDAGGRILDRAPGEPGLLRALDAGGKEQLVHELVSLRFQELERLLGIDLAKLRFEVALPYGSDEIRGVPALEQLRVVNAAGSSARIPGILEPRALALLPEVQKTIEGSVATLGLPDGLRRIHLEFDIFLPPGVGGTGGGGVITLDSAVLHPFACAGDPLPGAYRHEYGHNLGFGHDPYMLLAEGGSATDETLYGTLAFRLLWAAAFQRTIDHLVLDRGERGFEWRPGASIYPALRALYGPDIHRRMIEERRASEQTLRLHGLSSIERIATLYSLALDRNVAWVFRAHGWPVFDERVDLGGKAVRFLKNHPRELNYAFVPGTEIRSWWVLDIDGPAARAAAGNGGGTNGAGTDGPADGAADAPPTLPPWRRVNWPSANIDLVIDGEPIAGNRRFLLFRRIAVPEECEARLLVASDVALEVRVNGTAIGSYDSSPQLSQPVHDELMLDQKRPLPVVLPRGESFIEIAVNQSPGSRGFTIGLATPDGEPLRLALIDDPPPGEESSKERAQKVETPPLLAGGFESAWKPAWVEGATEPPGALRFTIDDGSPAVGKGALEVELLAPATGAIIQRAMVSPGTTYRLRAAMRSEDFEGEAFVGLFTGELGGVWFARTEPLKKNAPWRALSAPWSPGSSRVVYIACYVKATRGRVWFDDVQLEVAD